MATSSYAKSLIGGLTADVKAAFGKVFEFILDGNLRFGAVDHQTHAENMAGVFLSSTTAASTGSEWSIPHGLGSTPTYIHQVMKPSVIGSQLIPDLKISRAADTKRIYFTSATSTGAPFFIYAE